ncbi:MAG: hypothetical protein M1546_25410 [Chloroflexi bacterium]|nr:hypothetical protein [Chloroflexota bacterium]
MAKLPVDLYDAVVEQLLPFMGTRDERQGELIPSLGGSPAYSRIEWDGAPKVFTVKLISLLTNDELITVLRRLSVGADRRAAIDALCARIAASGAGQPQTGVPITSPQSIIALNLIGYLERRGYLAWLVDAVRRARPNAQL